ncbi:hypothetical protein B0H19DRAFT_1065692 [Mycena capillaripes]|nr:hypothetical protein B0H19DRAFT_1065692 [Mycena capillaripes]
MVDPTQADAHITSDLTTEDSESAWQVLLASIESQGIALIGAVDRRIILRRVYAAKVDGRNSETTVTVYQGCGGEEEWREDIARYSRLRWIHKINEMDLKVDLIPFQVFSDRYRDSPIVAAYIKGYYVFTEMATLTLPQAAKEYVQFAFQRWLIAPARGLMVGSQWSSQCTFWTRRSTGGLCVELIPSKVDYRFGRRVISFRDGINLLDATNAEAMVIEFLTLQQYHKICYYHFSRRRIVNISSLITVTLGRVNYCNHPDGLDEIASLADVEVTEGYWYGSNGPGELMENGWSRDLLDGTFYLDLDSPPLDWLSQAQHIFSRLQITSTLENYYLQTERSSFRWPLCPAYWSLDPLGVEHLTAQEAAFLGFPTIQLTMKVSGPSWDGRVYAGLRQFHRSKGFDPDTLDIARHLGHHIFQLSKATDPQFAHVDAENSDEVYQAAPSDFQEIPLISPNFKIVMNAQIGLIIFLAFSWLYENCWQKR